MREEIVNKGYLDGLDLTEMMAFPFFFLFIIFMAYLMQMRHVKRNPSYTFLARGVLAKMVGGAVFCLVYIYYYQGGDTISYFESARSFCKLFEIHLGDFGTAFFSKCTRETYSLFDQYTGLPHSYIYLEGRTAFVVKFLVPILMLGFQSYLLSTLLLSVLSFFGIWRMYQVLCRYYPSLYKPIGIVFLFFPSAIFWGSGILKDTITLSAFYWFVSAVEIGFITKQQRLMNGVIILISGYIVILVKPYILMAAVPGLTVWLLHERVLKIKSVHIRYLFIPFIYVISIGIGSLLMVVFENQLDKFALNKVLDTAGVTQKDLQNEEYRGHSFNIGDLDGSVTGMLVHFPQATIAGLFRPFIWESKNMVMLLSGLENIVLLFLFVYTFVKLGIRKVFSILFNEPLLMFLFSFSILFAFSIGISTSNFGALIRFKIPFAPLFASLLIVLFNYKKLTASRKTAYLLRERKRRFSEEAVL